LWQVPELLPSGDPEGEGLTAESRDSMSVAAELRESAREQLLKLSNQPPPQVCFKGRILFFSFTLLGQRSSRLMASPCVHPPPLALRS